MTPRKAPRVRLGTVGHFGLSVRDPDRSAKWWSAVFDLDEIFRYDGGVGLSNDAVTLVLHRGRPSPKTIGLWFHDPDGYRWELSVQNGAKEKTRRR